MEVSVQEGQQYVKGQRSERELSRDLMISHLQLPLSSVVAPFISASTEFRRLGSLSMDIR